MDKVKCMMIQLELPKGLQAETLLVAYLLVNLSLYSTIDFKTPHEKWSGKPVDYSKIKVFGCTTYAHINQGNLAPRALKELFIGYPERALIWCTNLSIPKCIINRDVVFNKEVVLNKNQSTGDTGLNDKTDDNVQFEVEQPI